jgi:hypothetical protein
MVLIFRCRISSTEKIENISMYSVMVQSLRGLRSILNAYISCPHASAGELLRLSSRYAAVALSTLETMTVEFVCVSFEAVRLLFACAYQDHRLYATAFHVSQITRK